MSAVVSASDVRSSFSHLISRPVSAFQRSTRRFMLAMGTRLSVPHSTSQRRRIRLSAGIPSCPRADRCRDVGQPRYPSAPKTITRMSIPPSWYSSYLRSSRPAFAGREPLERGPQPLSDADFRAPAEPPRRPLRVQADSPDLELLGGGHLDRGLPPGMAYEHSDHVGDARFAPGAHVRLSRPPAVERRDVGVGDVADEREVARLHTVAEDPRRAAVQEPVARDRDDARFAGPILARAVDVAVAQGERRNAVTLAECREVDLLRPLGRPIGRQWRGACGLRRWQLLRIAVDGAA